jgi:hypothetical protein
LQKDFLDEPFGPKLLLTIFAIAVVARVFFSCCQPLQVVDGILALT